MCKDARRRCTLVAPPQSIGGFVFALPAKGIVQPFQREPPSVFELNVYGVLSSNFWRIARGFDLYLGHAKMLKLLGWTEVRQFISAFAKAWLENAEQVI
jgi:hypothetical protein